MANTKLGEIHFRRPGDPECRPARVISQAADHPGVFLIEYGALSTEKSETTREVSRPHDPSGGPDTFHESEHCPFAVPK